MIDVDFNSVFPFCRVKYKYLYCEIFFVVTSFADEVDVVCARSSQFPSSLKLLLKHHHYYCK